ncbi:hypothetical protein ACP70R_014140 [Stipagrostis hirtigluma subsp. patula]
MVRVHSAAFSSLPQPSPELDPAAATSDDDPTTTRTMAKHGGEKREVFTIWMKSLVLNGRGCTVYDSAGSIVYRVDNYGARRAADVCLMDLAGNVVLQILKKKLGFGRRWEGYRWSEHEQEPAAAPRRRRRPWFKVDRLWAWRGPSCCACELGGGGGAVRYRVDGRVAPARAARIVDGATGLAVAEVKRKTTAAGLALGDDVLTLAVDPGVDRAIIMGLVLVHGLINRAM